jgi:hypothetical protein
MSSKQLQIAAFYLVDAHDFKTFTELKEENLKLQRQIGELMKYRDLHASALQSHFESKLQELHNKLKSRPGAVSKETLEPNEANENHVQSGGGLNVQSTEQPSNLEDLNNETLIQAKLLNAFEKFMETHKTNNVQVGGGDDTTPQLAIPLPEYSTAPSDLDVPNESSSSIPESTVSPDANYDHLINLVPTQFQNKARQLLQELQHYSSELLFDNNNQVLLNGQPLPDVKATTVFPQLYSPVKKNCLIAPIVDEIASLGLGHLIARHYTKAITPRGPNYLKDRHKIRATLHSLNPWYYVAHNE